MDVVPLHCARAVLENDEFAEAVRVRLGAGGPTDVGVCGACGQAVLDAGGSHASCCAVGEATRGHNAVRVLLFDFSLSADDATEKEPQGLIPSRPALRPADVLSPCKWRRRSRGDVPAEVGGTRALRG